MDHLLKIRFLSELSLIILVLYLTNVESVPEPYCLQTFNYSDCGMPRTAVFHYYKPGSRCEIVYWYGCPTANMFADQYQCSHHCTARLSHESRESQDNRGKKWNEKLDELNPNELEKVEDIVNDIGKSIESETEPDGEHGGAEESEGAGEEAGAKGPEDVEVMGAEGAENDHEETTADDDEETTADDDEETTADDDELTTEEPTTEEPTTDDPNQ